jgi:hypothetical protein
MIMSKDTRSEKVSEFLRILPQQGPDAMKFFINTLIETEQETLANQLEPELFKIYHDTLQHESALPQYKAFRMVIGTILPPYTTIQQPNLTSGYYNIGVLSIHFEDVNAGDFKGGYIHVKLSNFVTSPQTYLVGDFTSPHFIIKTIHTDNLHHGESYDKVEYFKFFLPDSQQTIGIKILSNNGRYCHVKATVILSITPLKDM